MRAPRNTIEVHAKWRRYPDDPHPPRRKILLATATGAVRDGKHVYRLKAPARRPLVLSLKAKLPDGAVCDVAWPGADT